MFQLSGFYYNHTDQNTDISDTYSVVSVDFVLKQPLLANGGGISQAKLESGKTALRAAWVHP